ncbi:MAG: hypothetical protein BWX79_00526 [Alphaproteobacteria bacterium ADurb.Bin100]|nr:MAG: hypothetical protein BWX79_00526 [Alphaproteobacteria bacterium ADurb.Bin100]
MKFTSCVAVSPNRSTQISYCHFSDWLMNIVQRLWLKFDVPATIKPAFSPDAGTALFRYADASSSTSTTLPSPVKNATRTVAPGLALRTASRYRFICSTSAGCSSGRWTLL